MLLTEQNICFYLLDKGYLEAKQVVDGEFRVDVADSRNRNFIVNKHYAKPYFIKTIKFLEQERTDSLRTEATCYWLANNDEKYKIMKDYVPIYHEFDMMNHILVLGLEANSMSLYDYYLGNQIFSLEIAERQAIILASYHRQLNNELNTHDSMRFFKKMKPWVMMLGNLENYKNLFVGQKAETQVLELIKTNPQFVELIGNITEDWQATSLMHGDIKFPNFLMNQSFLQGEPLTLKLIDWELADIGDPCWDVAAVFQNYLSLWVYGDIDKTFSQFSLPNLQPSMRHFWQHYAQQMSFTPEESAGKLLKIMRFCAIKLIHTCFETTPNTNTLQPHSAKLLQLSFNILKSPQQAISSILSIF